MALYRLTPDFSTAALMYYLENGVEPTTPELIYVVQKFQSEWIGSEQSPTTSVFEEIDEQR